MVIAKNTRHKQTLKMDEIGIQREARWRLLASTYWGLDTLYSSADSVSILNASRMFISQTKPPP